MNPIDARRLHPGNPLWQRVPTRDRAGRQCVDFMLLIPGIKHYSPAAREAQWLRLRDSLALFEQSLEYVDFNQQLGLIWVSLKPVPGIMKVVVLAIQQQLPEARLVASQFHPDPAAAPRRQPRLLGFGRRLRRRLWQRLGRGQQTRA